MAKKKSSTRSKAAAKSPKKKKTPAKKAKKKKKAPAKRSSAAKAAAALVRRGLVAAVEEFLGHDKAVSIVCGCAQTSASNLGRTLTQLGVDGISFQRSVFDGVDRAGFVIAIDDIPNASSNTLFDVVTVIENAPRKS